MYVKVSRGFRPSCKNRGASTLRGFCILNTCFRNVILMGDISKNLRLCTLPFIVKYKMMNKNTNSINDSIINDEQ